jgi:hypothetical protein
MALHIWQEGILILAALGKKSSRPAWLNTLAKVALDLVTVGEYISCSVYSW